MGNRRSQVDFWSQLGEWREAAASWKQCLTDLNFGLSIWTEHRVFSQDSLKEKCLCAASDCLSRATEYSREIEWPSCLASINHLAVIYCITVMLTVGPPRYQLISKGSTQFLSLLSSFRCHSTCLDYSYPPFPFTFLSSYHDPLCHETHLETGLVAYFILLKFCKPILARTVQVISDHSISTAFSKQVSVITVFCQELNWTVKTFFS